MDADKPLLHDLPNEEALFGLMSLYYDELFRYGIKFTADVEVTKDALNQFFIHIWDSRLKLENVENIKAYLFVSYKRWLILTLQTLKRQRPVALSDYSSDQLIEQPYEEYLIAQIRNSELSHALREAIKGLPARQRELVQLRFYEHLSFEEIAEKTSLSLRTVYNKLHEAIKKLRNYAAIRNLR